MIPQVLDGVKRKIQQDSAAAKMVIGRFFAP